MLKDFPSLAEFKSNVLKLYWEKLTMLLYANPIIVYQMPKTGSGSITHSLKKHGLKNVFHLHEIIPNRHYSKYTHQIAKVLYQHIIDRKLPVKIITATREPIAMNVSNFFQQLYSKSGKLYETPNLKQRIEQENLDVDDLITIFFESYPHQYPLNWFDDNVKQVFGIDVFTQDFFNSNGYLDFHHDNIDLIVLKSEDDDRLKEKYLNDFLSLDNFTIERTNVTTQKKFKFSEQYNNFKKELVFPQDYLDKMYNSKYTKHFYTPAEIEKFRSKWQTNISSTKN